MGSQRVRRDWVAFTCAAISHELSPLFQYPIILRFHTVHGVLKARILKWFAIPFSSGPHSVRSLHHDPPVLFAPQAWLNFIELDTAVGLV